MSESCEPKLGSNTLFKRKRSEVFQEFLANFERFFVLHFTESNGGNF